MAIEFFDRQVAAIAQWLGVFHSFTDTVELRALGVGGRRAVCEVFGDPQALARRAAELDGAGASGCYFTLNPLRPDLAGSTASCRKADVTERHWLPLDIDPYRPKDCSSTDAELIAAAGVLGRCRSLLDAEGCSGAVVGHSGNGYHLCYPVLLPNDDDAQATVKAALKGLHARCGDRLTDEEKEALKAGTPLVEAKAKVEEDVHDAPRIWKLYGTRARKGPHTDERPHRFARLIEGEPWQRSVALDNTAALAALVVRWGFADDIRRGRPQLDAGTYARAALEQESAAVAAATVGERNNQLNRSAYNLGQLVGAGVLDRGEAEAALLAAAAAAGLGEGESRATLSSGLDSGALVPRDLGKIGKAHTNGSTPAGRDPGPPCAAAGPFPAPIPASQLQAGAPAPPLWRGLIHRGEITLLAALWKSGKTTLLLHLIRAMEAGGDFCGLSLAAGSVLYVTEESEGRWARRRDAVGLADHIDFVVRPFGAKSTVSQWLGFLAYLNGLLKAKPRDLVVFDTLTDLWPVKDENDAGQVQAALMPLHSLNGSAGLLLVHHTRKCDGTEATASRGSGALTAFVDTIVEFRRMGADDRNDRRRLLTSYGRGEDVPDEMVIELTDLDGYVLQGKRADVTARDLAPEILAHLPTVKPGLTFDELLESWPAPRPGRQALFAALGAGVESERWVCYGRGVKGDPRRYYVPGADSVFDSPSQ